MNKISSICLLLCILFACEPKEPSRPINLAELTIGQIHEAYRNGTYNAEQLVEAYLERIDAYDSAINSITTVNSEAIAIAKALDEEFGKTGKLRPLHGIPIVVKDNINTVGIATTAGSLALQNYLPEENAFIIKKLVAAGAIVLAKTNMAEWAFSPMHSESSTAGITHNPYSLDYVPAGSSGGTGAAVAANFGAAGLGTDTGNSIRGPSSHNALVGFRTTMGLVSREGIVPLYLRNDVVGPMCRTVEDAARMLEVMAGYDPADSLTRYSEGKIPASYTQFLTKGSLKGARIGVLRELSDAEPHPEIKALFEQALVDMQNLGADIVDPFIVPHFAELREDQWCATFREDLETFLASYVKNDNVQTLEDIIRIGTVSGYTRKRLERNAAATGRWDDKETPCLDAYTDAKRVAFRNAIEQAMDSLQLDVIVYPSWNHPPATIARFEEDYKGDNNQIISPHTGQPAFTVPMGFTSGYLPAGLQFLGRMYAEPTLIMLAYDYEQGTKHRVAPVLE